MKNFLEDFFYYWIPVIFWAALIFFLSSQPGLKISTGIWDFLTRKPAHVFEYFIFTLLLIRAIRSTWVSKFEGRIFYSSKKSVNLVNIGNNYNVLLFAFFLSLLYAVSDEFHQSTVPLREGKFSDILFDSLGILLAIVLVWRLFLNQCNKQKKLPKTWRKN